MKRLNCEKIKLVLIVFSVAIVLGGGKVKADYVIGEPVNVNTEIPAIIPLYDYIDCFSPDGLEIYIDSGRQGGYDSQDLWVFRRTSTSAPWGQPVNLGSAINGQGMQYGACLSSDGLQLYYASSQPGGYGGWDLYMVTRPTKDAPWGEPVNLGPTVNSEGWDVCPWISRNGLELYFSSATSGSSARTDGYGNLDIYVSKRATVNDPWGEPVNLGPVVNSSYQETQLSLSPDDLVLVWTDSYGPRPGGFGDQDIWMSRRASLTESWSVPVNLGPIVNSNYGEHMPRFSLDGSTLYFDRLDSNGSYRFYLKVPIVPIIDFDDNGVMDINDLVIMIESWGTNESLCDIGPFAWGDGIVDRVDLEILMEYWNQVVDAAAYYKLDEIEGLVACDSSGCDHDAALIGDPNWQYEAGICDGAIELDGIDDYISTPFILNPTDGPFSIFAWIKGGEPGQVILSQNGNANLLSSDSSTGYLKAEIKGNARGTKALVSQSVVTDGNWHHVGLVWDGLYRTLYVDDVIAAQDTLAQSTLLGSTNGFYIGCGKDKAVGSFYTGLIDDVRIYNRVIIP